MKAARIHEYGRSGIKSCATPARSGLAGSSEKSSAGP